MSLREKAQEVKAAGEAARGDFTPSGAPLRAYKYWAARSKNVPDRENFCHFWRVVVFWAPFMAFRRGVESMFSSPVFLGLVAAVCLVAIVLAGLTWTEFGAAALLVFVTIYACAGLVFGAVYADEKAKGRSENWLKWSTFATLPTSWASYSAMTVSNKLDRSTKRTVGNALLALIATAGLIAILVAGFADLGWSFLLVLLGFVLALAVFVAVIIALGNVAQSLRAYKYEKKAAAIDNDEDEPVEEKTPGKVSQLLTSIADFLILAVQVVRVNKWKICPLVTIDEVDRTKTI